MRNCLYLLLGSLMMISCDLFAPAEAEVNITGSMEFNTNVGNSPNYEFQIVNVRNGECINEVNGKLNVDIGDRIKLIVDDPKLSQHKRRGGVIYLFSFEFYFENVPWEGEVVVPDVRKRDYPVTCKSGKFNLDQKPEMDVFSEDFTMYLTLE